MILKKTYFHYRDALLRRILPIFYRKINIKNGINKSEVREKKLIISLTSYPKRLNNIDLCIKSLLNQKMKPDKIILFLGEDTPRDCLPKSLVDLEKVGLEICFVEDDLKPHKKYIYAMKMFPNDIIITVDDDIIYDRRLIKSLFNSYLKNPKCISARRVHRMKFFNKNIQPYNMWDFGVKSKTASFDLCAIGIGGVLYPPHSLHPDAFDVNTLKEICLGADDIWLKYMELRNNIPVVYVKSTVEAPILIKDTQEVALSKQNVTMNNNDKYIRNLEEKYGYSWFDLILKN